jgi:hypothetical protein
MQRYGQRIEERVEQITLGEIGRRSGGTGRKSGAHLIQIDLTSLV